MAQDIGFDFAGTNAPTVTLLASDIANNGVSALTSAVDFGGGTTVGPLWISFALTITGQASASNFAFLECVWSLDNSVFGNIENVKHLATIKCLASADSILVGSFQPEARYAKFRLNNKSGGAIDGTSSNTALLMRKIFLNQV